MMMHSQMAQVLRVLFLEDSSADAELFQAQIPLSIRANWQIVHVTRLQEAIAHLLNEEPFDAILSDLFLPDAVALDTVCQFRAIAPHIPLIVLTCLDDTEFALEAVRQGAQDYLIKGNFDYPLLERSLRYAIERCHAQALLLQSEERFKSVLKNSPIVVFSQDANLQYTWVYNLPDGFEPEQVIGHYDRDLFSEAEVAQLTAIKQRVLETRQTQRVELPLTLNGQVHYFDFNIEPYGEQNGKPMGLRGVATDISDRKRIEAQLQQREAELAKAQKMARLGSWKYVIATQQITWTPETYELTGFDPTKPPPSPAEFLNYVPSPDAEILHNTIQQSLQLNQPFQLEHRFIHPNGKILWFLLKGEPVTNPQGEVLSLTNVVFDITERKQAELELESQKAFLRQIIESVPSSIFAKDIFGRYLAINQAEAARMGCQVEEAIGKSDAELLGNSAVVEQYRQIEQAVMATGEPYLSAPHSETDSQGNVCWYQVAINPFLNPQGKIQGIIGSATNITELKQIEDQLRLSEARYRSVVDNLQEAVFQTDADGRWIFLNPAWTGITGFSIEESLGTCFLDYVHPEDRQSNLNLLLPLLRRERDYCQHSIRYLTKSGGVRWLEVVARLRTDSQGNFLGTSGTLFDITERKQTEQALRHSEELFRLVFDKAPVGTGLIDTHTLKLTQVNQTYRQILGYEEAELLGKTLIDITAPEDLDADLQQMTRLLCGEISTFRMEKRFIRKDGSRVWTDLVVTLLPSHGLTSSQTLGIIQDISDRKQAEAELRKSEASLAAAQKLARIGNWQFDLFSQKISWSAEAFEIFGCDRNQPEPNYAEFLAAMPLEDAEALQARVKRTIQTGEPYEIEHRYVKADGSTIYVLGKGEIVTNIRGQAVGLFGTVMEITQRKRTEDALRESEEKFRQMAETINDLFWMSTQNYQDAIYVSPAFERILGKFGLTPGAVFAQWLNSIHPDDRDRALTNFSHIHREGCEQEYRVIRPGGKLCWIRDRAFPIYDKQGKIYRIVGLAEDISDRKQAEARLQQSLRDKEVLLKEVHHRVKNNLQVISALFSLQAESIQDLKVKSVLQDSENRVRSMALIHETLYRSTNLGQVNFSQYIYRLANSIFMTSSTHYGHIQLNYDLAAVSLNLETAVPCGLLLNELITNAIKHAFPNKRVGEILISLKQLPDSLELATSELAINPAQTRPPKPKYELKIRDNGIGLPPNFAIENLQSLGLKVAYDLALQLRGTLDLKTQGGTEFRLIFSELTYSKRL
ncbi:PAS domain S-box protein [Desertifilum sp. FACHB-1129]|uniref:histidine kinase n=1 Tax=Desertifilum tharense IPPAS B-1220 TaxID=1781255 RepID=A0A1E5QJT2_9CYAN|nr:MULTISPECIES: PAS domain S-box protein [Desertifilum]MDA0211429.1 PAS domain S-box protein [Cyanobacteria bacterium FC1]MBD2313525.1 PAS domain S-box protein [Desertifilum sp. FACHB-1129]MBD2323857.1 PAS domain S-box protein [Desertifilum sp. FACHB-866]MBD2333702.1 PAS domain S-box protein [Desertifilum sp. FACHB-868]OEJ74956.1 hypothetical protein BH720_12095 [Desertifilum tharense IPPAS B-1220]